MPLCWASSIGGCSDEASKEHLISRAVFPEARQVTVVGLPWCKGKPKSVGLASVVSKILCKAHNNALSPIDAEAGRALHAIATAVALGNERSAAPPQKWEVTRSEISTPELLERWFLKTAINLFVVHPNGMSWRQTGSPADVVPEILVRQAFGLVPIAKPYGLYFFTAIGDTIDFRNEVVFEPITYAGPNIIAALFSFQGLRFVFHLEPFDLPPELSIPGPLGGSTMRSLAYHLRKLSWTVGGALLHETELAWHG